MASRCRSRKVWNDFVAVGATSPPTAWVSGSGRGRQQELVDAVGGTVGRELVEGPAAGPAAAPGRAGRSCAPGTGNGSSPGHTSNTSVSVAMAATSWSWSHSIDPTPRPGEIGVPLPVARRSQCMWPVRTSTTSPGSTVTPAAARGRVEVVAVDGVAVVEVVDALEPGDVEQDPRVTIGPNCSMPSARGAASSVTAEDGDPVVEQAVVADVRERVPVRRRLQPHVDHVVAGPEVGRVAGEGGVIARHRPLRVHPAQDPARSADRPRRTGSTARTRRPAARRRRPAARPPRRSG